MFKIKNFKERKTMENKNVNELDIIELARELGKKLQKEDAFIKYRLAKQTADEDPELQRLLLLGKAGGRAVQLHAAAGLDSFLPIVEHHICGKLQLCFRVVVYALEVLADQAHDWERVLLSD